jgi:hypothetical protein
MPPSTPPPPPSLNTICRLIVDKKGDVDPSSLDVSSHPQIKVAQREFTAQMDIYGKSLQYCPFCRERFFNKKIIKAPGHAAIVRRQKRSTTVSASFQIPTTWTHFSDQPDFASFWRRRHTNSTDAISKSFARSVWLD